MITAEVFVTPTYSFEPDESPDSLDIEVLEEFLDALGLDDFQEAVFTDLSSGDFVVITNGD